MLNKYSKIYNLIKKHKRIIIARHLGPDPDAIASQTALRNSIKLTFPKKEVYAVGAGVAKFKYFGKLDKVNDIDYENDLLITLDVPDIKRVDGVDVTKFKNSIKIDHHPIVDKYATIEWIDAEASSTCQLILELINNTKLRCNKDIAGSIFMGIVSDTNRFLFDYTSPKTFRLVSDLIERYKLKTSELYSKLYKRPLSDIRLMGYIASNLIVTENKFAYIKLNEKIIEENGGDFSSVSNMINDFNNINEILIWMFITYDSKAKIHKINIRSRGPFINEIASKYNGGGHKVASGARIEKESDVDKLINELDKVCKGYKE